MIDFLILLFLIALSFFFSGSETAFFSLNKVRLEKFKKRNRKALGVESLKSEPDFLLSTILMGNMIVNIALSSLIAKLFIKISPSWGGVISVFSAAGIILILGEILPKGIAINTPEKFSLTTLFPLKIFYILFRPFCWIFISFSKLFLRWIPQEVEKAQLLDEEELKTALELGRLAGIIAKEEKDMIHLVLEFAEKEAGQILTPRTEVKALDIDTPPEEVEDFLKEVKHSYLPVYKGSIDNIVGVLRTKDYFLGKEKDIRSLIREAFFVPESKKIDDLLRELIKREEKMALVIDEYGGFSGIVTLEDIQEEIFGEIYDEYEVPENKIEKIKDKEFLVSPDVSIKELNYKLELDLPEEKVNLGRFILSLIERFPQEKEKIFYKDLEFIVEKATKKKLITLRVIKK
ncbi:MAG: hypothetical protein DRP61_02670 [Candidatus Omnitrophota bacterium]|nr:MAG: hypothetical protein DRP61_02670 [Candidatus Omnitrophota bacterium]